MNFLFQGNLKSPNYVIYGLIDDAIGIKVERIFSLRLKIFRYTEVK